MLSGADAELARRDSRLPGLALLLDPEAFAARLRRAWSGRELVSGTSAYVRYKPGTSCLVAYRFQASGSTLDVYAKAVPRERLGEVRGSPGVGELAAAAGGRRLVLGEEAAVVFAFPDDDKIAVLARLGDAEGRAALLRKLLPGRPEAWEGRVATLRYKPERRYVAVVGEGTRLVLKAYAGEEFETAQSNARALRSCGTLRLARRLGRSRRHRILALEWLSGGLLREAMGRPDFDPARLGPIGACLAEFHRQPPDRLPVPPRGKDVEAWGGAARAIGRLCPRLAGRATTLAGRLAAPLAEDSPAARAIHGDFDASQVLVEGERTAFLDLDQAARGDPAADLGGFVARMERDALGRRLPAGRVGPFVESLMEGYREASGETSRARLALFTAGNLLQMASEPFRLREPDRPDRVEETLARAEAVFRAGSGFEVA
ncbi:MAG: phosphotransferase [Planctomycetes bacterium]|nr:phosphotransferase [Planctomycetota bacterium]